MKDSLEFLDDFRPGFEATIRARVPDESLAAIDDALPTDWIPGPHTRAVIDAVVEELGRDEAPTLWRELVSRKMIRSPLIRGLVQTVSALGGQSPKTLLKALPRGWRNAYRDFGRPKIVSSNRGEMDLVFEGVPAYLFHYRQHWVAIEGVLLGLVKTGGGEGRVSLRFEPEERSVYALVTW